MDIPRRAGGIKLRHVLAIVGALALGALGTARAQSHDAPGKYGAPIGDVFYSNDSDHFEEERANLGYLFPNGWGVGTSITHYSAPGWSATGRGAYGQYYQHDAKQTVDGRLGVMDTDGHTTVTGTLDYMRHLTADTGLGVSVGRDVVDSEAGIEKGLTYNSLLLVFDHQFTSRVSVGVAAGALLFSDDNTRPLLRTRWTYELVENSGLNAYVKTRTYYDTNPDQGNYFSPRWLNEASGGVSWRTAVGDKAIFFVNADAGRQNLPDAASNIWSVRGGAQNHRSRTVQWQVAVETTNNRASGFAIGGSSYRYTSVMGRLLFPLN
ncbi:hypothetical protein QCE73_25065 [Caballeronia sp. LZ029]|uniref:hypothetical protein n=1 Tax=Caballeronia sp. LZ029 TaxID=3038564 RepID=UPI002863AA1B|nr:hypothetical protein [Caballeronia sp. LZ029]MDR5746447.1 hypothetical protein [Caballeronia sp. LZ029]